MTYDFEADRLIEPMVIGGPGVAPGATLTRQGTTVQTGNGALKINTAAVANQGIILDLPGTFSTAYGAAAWFKANAGDSVKLVMQRADGSGTPDSTAIAATGNWQRIAVSWGGLGTGRAQVAFIANNAQAAAHTVYLDAVSVWRTSDPSVGAPTTTEYDSAGRVIASIAPVGLPGDPSAAPMVTASAYDSMSRLTSVTVNRIAGAANATDVNLDTSYTYDQLGRRLTTTDPLGHVSAAEWDRLGRQLAGYANYVGGGTTKTDSQNLTAVARYDDLGQLLATCDPQAVKG